MRSTVVHRGFVLSVVIALVAIGCGSDESGAPIPSGGDVEVGASTPAGDESEPSGEGVTMSVAALCDPVEDRVAAWAGGPVAAGHNDVYASFPEPILVCEWQVDGVDRSIRVDYVGVPDSFMHNLVDGKQDRSDVVAPNFHDKSSFWLIAPNGWGVVVSNLGAEQSQDLDAMVDIAQVALAQIAA